jgi:hypothetical protein
LKSPLPHISDELRKIIAANYVQQNLDILIEKEYLSNRIDYLLKEIERHKSNASASVPVPLPVLSGSSPSNPKPKKRGGSENLTDAREYLKKAKGRARLDYIVSLRSWCTETSQLTEGARNFIYTAVTPIVKCLEEHHNNDKEQFLHKWPLTRGITTFRTKNCNCKSPVCGIS